MGYDRSSKDYRGGPEQPTWDYAEDGPKIAKAFASGRAALAKYQGTRSRSQGEKAALSVTRWSADEPAPVTLSVAVTHEQAKPPAGEEAVLFAYPHDVTALFVGGGSGSSDGPKARGIVRWNGSWDQGAYDNAPFGGELHGQVLGLDGQPITLTSQGAATFDGVRYTMYEVNEGGARGNLPNGTVIPVSTRGQICGLTDGVVVGSNGATSNGGYGVGLVRFTGRVRPNSNPIDPHLGMYGSGPFYIDDPEHGRVTLMPSPAMLSPRGPFVAIEDQEVYLELQAEYAEGTWTNFPAGTPVHVLPRGNHAQGWFTIPDLGAGYGWEGLNDIYLKSQTSDEWNIYTVDIREITPASEGSPASGRFHVLGCNAWYDDPQPYARTLGPILARQLGETDTIAAEVTTEIVPQTEWYESNIGAHWWTDGVVVGAPGSLVLDNPSPNPDENWKAGPGVSITDASGFQGGSEPAFTPTGSGFEGGADPEESVGAGIRLPAAGVLRVTYAVGEVRRTLELDLRSGSYQLPPCSDVEVSAWLFGSVLADGQPAEGAPPLVVAASLVPGQVDKPAPMLATSTVQCPMQFEPVLLLTPPGAVALRVLYGSWYPKFTLHLTHWNHDRYGDPYGDMYRSEEAALLCDPDNAGNSRNIDITRISECWIPVQRPSMVIFSSALADAIYTIQFLIEP